MDKYNNYFDAVALFNNFVRQINAQKVISLQL